MMLAARNAAPTTTAAPATDFSRPTGVQQSRLRALRPGAHRYAAAVNAGRAVRMSNPGGVGTDIADALLRLEPLCAVQS
jgi:hypothetical protein